MRILKFEAMKEVEKLECDLRGVRIKFHKIVAEQLAIEEKLDEIRKNKENWEAP